MNTSRRGTGRKSQNVPRENTQSISRFVNQRTREDLVEIDDDDEVQDLTDQFAFADEELQPIQVKRKKKRLILEEDSDDDDIDDLQDVDENERRQLKEALRQSRLDMEIDAKRRAADISLKAKITKSCETPENKEYSDDETQDYLSENIQSSHSNSGLERQQAERAESPDLFGTPRSSHEKDELENTPDTLNSPSKSPMKSKTIFSDDIAVRITPIKRQLDSGSKNKLKLKKKESLKEQEKEVKLSSNDKEVDSFVESKKRKHCVDDEDSNAENSEDEFAGKDSKKKQKTIDQVFNVGHVKKFSPPHVVINDDDDEEDDSINQEGEKGIKRNDPTAKVKKAVRIRLERVYKKPKLSIKTIKDAMKARLYFAPAGIDPKAYTYAIVRMMDHTRKCIYRAQKKSMNFVKWGKPVLVGPREANSLDARKEKKKSVMAVAPMSVHGTAGEERKRSLRSAQIQATSAPGVKSKPAEPTTEESTRKRTSYIDSDESDDDLTKSVFGDEATTKPRPSWKEYLSDKESADTFGENVVTATDYKENAVGTNAFKRENPTTNVTSSSHTRNIEASRKGTPVKQTEICGNGNKWIKREQRNEEFEKIPNIVDMDSSLNSKDKRYDKSPSKYSKNVNNDEKVEVLGMGEDDGIPNKAKVNEKRGIPGLDVKDEEDIDSSAEIVMNRSKRNGKTELIEDVKEEGSHGSVPKFGIEVKDENENENHQDTSTISAAQDFKPGASLTNVAVMSGYLKVDRSPKKPPGLQRVMSSAARRAAEAAEKRMRASVSSHSSPAISSNADPSQDIPSSDNSRVECPMCFSKFPKEDVETHASTCDGSASVFFSPRKPTTSSASHKSVGSPTDSEGQRSDKDYGLKNLRVMVTRSPEAHRKLMEQRSLSSSKARRNLSLNKASRGGAGSANSEDGGVRRSRRFIDMTGDGDDDEEEEDVPKTKDESSQEQNEDSQPYDWFSSASQLERKKKKFRVKYGGRKKGSSDPRESPFSTLDFIPLEENPSSIETVDHGDYHHAVDKEGKDDECESGIEKMDEKKDDGNDVMSENASTSKVIEAGRKLDVKYGSIDSDSGESDIEIFAAYGVKVQSKKRKCKSEDPDARNINDILRPQRQENPKKKKKTTEDFDEEDYENEMALLELSGVPLKRSNVGNKSKETLATRRRHKRISSSDESDDNNDEYEDCYICSERVPKEEFKDHTDACLKRDDASFVTPGKGSGKASDKSDISSSPRTRSKSTIKPPKAGSSEQIIEMDSDEIGDSPIKTFKLIGEDSGSCVDFSNQFSFFKGRESKRRSKGSGRNRGGNKYRGKGRYMHKRGRGKRKN